MFILFWNSMSILSIKNSEIVDWTSEAIKSKFQVAYYTNIFKWINVYTHIYIYI